VLEVELVMERGMVEKKGTGLGSGLEMDKLKSMVAMSADVFADMTKQRIIVSTAVVA